MPSSSSSLQSPVSGLSTAVVIVAAGSSSRLRGNVPKQWRLLGGIPLVAHSFRFFDRCEFVGQIVVALDAESLGRPDRLEHLASRNDKIVRHVQGGPHRQQTVYLALQALDPKPDIVLIHDAARPFPPIEGVLDCVEMARNHGGAIVALPVIDTIKRVNDQREITGTIDRNELWAAQTPQGFRFGPLMASYRAHAHELDRFTDDAGIFEANGGCVHVVMGSVRNFKVTTPEDVRRAEQFLVDTSLPVMVREKVFIYITRGDSLLVFTHTDYPDAGVQVPAGTMKAGEEHASAALREAIEETGLEKIHHVGYLGDSWFRWANESGQETVEHRHFHHFACDQEIPDVWRHAEKHADRETPADPSEWVWFDFYWVRLPDEATACVTRGPEMIGRLAESMGLANANENGRDAQ